MASAATINLIKNYYITRSITKFSMRTVELRETKLGTLRLLVLGGIIENQNSDFVME
jgi:hypothetical protein